jgi:pimeloyl-ACP methyl ester carboxylesterase
LITLTTRDDIRLEADLYAGVAGCPGVVLIHMIPPSNNRDGWPSEFIDRLTAHGWSVVAYDRRGTRNSEGIPVDSFEGEAGRWDVEAAVAALTDAGAEGLALIGASNGTASVIDYAAWASAEGLPEVLAMGFMSGGGYTEAQTSMADVPSVPAVFTYDPSEAAWPEGQMQYDPGNWVFHEYDGGGHGTQTFGLKPKVKGDLEDFLVESL